ncbi:opioid-binding protein/cell adhesion molecule [Plakobranchus ocellatus]|uniref:Opioid-binding protein/cell adhesion molecule n=1 Tax=Plakobranchus ocellatus TaxID=259542 RepID=A0AAV3YYY7_9GAST|nr:opioid-binding protein/cell adhesion molecule [Plakobranchus ocellatus]
MLIVVVPPSISSPPKDTHIDVREFERVTLTCNASGTPEPSIRWYRQPSKEGKQKTSQRVGDKGEILIIHNVTRDCGGQYQCVADNAVKPFAKRTWDVRVAFEPEVKLANRRLGQSLGKDTVLECVVKGYPQGSVFWSFNGRQVGSSKKYKLEILQDNPSQLTLNLHIFNIQQEDYGVYTCSANNDMGRAHRRMKLYEHKGRAQASPTTTTSTTSTTTKPRNILSRTYKPHGVERLAPGHPPKGRAGVGHNRHGITDTGYREGSYNQHQTGPAASKHSDGTDSSPHLVLVTSSSKILILIISLWTVLFNHRISLCL